MKPARAGIKKTLVFFLRLALVLIALLCLFFALSLIVIEPPDPRLYPVSPRLNSRDGALYHAELSARGEWLLPVPLSRMGPHLPRLAVAAEDKRFFSHIGVDPLALLRALKQNLFHLGRVSGASTVTAQVVRILEPGPRTVFNKYLEFVKAVKLESRFTKDEILEFYLNLAPFGGNVRGAEAASRIYFGKNAAQLSLGESALLVSVWRGPSLYRPDRHPERAERRRNFLLDNLARRGELGLKERDRALLEPVSGLRRPVPRENPHLARTLLAGLDPRLWTLGGEGVEGFSLSLDPFRQRDLEENLKLALEGYPPEITAAGIILDNRTGEVLAYLGNARRKGPHSQVDCARARRSTGSTLKPFVYLAAFEDSLLNPASLLADTRDGLSGLAPRNFNGRHRGPVSAGTALAFSLNVPAVRVARLVGEKRALFVLSAFGVSLDASRSYGDSLVLGGAEATLMELARAYGVLARGGGDFVPVFFAGGSAAGTPRVEGEGDPKGTFGDAFGEDAKAAAGKRPAASPAAVFLINEALTDDGRLPPALRGLGRPFKTGTSHGLRDAWFVIYSPGHTVALWMGDPAGRGHRDLSGLKALSRPATEIMKALGGDEPFQRPSFGIKSYLACPVSGEPVGPWCPPGIEAQAVESGFRTEPCRLHRLAGGERVSLWPPELASFLGRGGKGAVKDSRRPEIVSPLSGGIFIRTATSTHIPLRAEGALPPVYWYVDGEFFAKEDALAPLWPLSLGSHTIGFIDAGDKSSSGAFEVRGVRRGDERLSALEFR
ncbi:MAG: transglycosylase domain-containing protein [Deltaproteobacteria bacterium]|jgi:penicillin-binding protein 1C|nr:transglycosylase domain-containing protein [Deltaproteobacteria bacterium]